MLSFLRQPVCYVMACLFELACVKLRNTVLGRTPQNRIYMTSWAQCQEALQELCQRRFEPFARHGMSVATAAGHLACALQGCDP